MKRSSPRIIERGSGSDGGSLRSIAAHHTLGCWRDNVFIERFWRTLKNEGVYLHAYDSVSDAKAQIAPAISSTTASEAQSSLQGRTPDTVYLNATAAEAA